MILETTGLGKRYGTQVALDGVDLAVAEGSVYGLVGPTGAGKTTLLALLAGLRRPTAGNVHCGVDRRATALLPDTPQFDPWLTGREVIALAKELVAPGLPDDRVDGALRDAGLADAATRRVGGYSRGMLQRLGLAATVVGEPELLLLDEPASALDPAGRREVLDLIAHLRGHATVVLSSHMLADVQEVCDTVGILRAGRLQFQGPLAGADVMNLWRLEWLRLVRTRRLLVVTGVYLFFGLTGPLTARYLSAILGRLGTEGIRVEFPPPRPADGIAQFVGNASQIGLLVVVLVASSALAFDARREMAVFLRTRVDNVRHIVVPAYAVNAAAAGAALTIGALAAWYETAVLLGGLPPARMLAGIAYGVLFLAFAVAVVAFVAALVRGVLATAGVTLVALLGLAIVGNVTGTGRWLPTSLLSALAGLVDGTRAADYLPAAVVTVVAGAVALLAAIGLTARCEI